MKTAQPASSLLADSAEDRSDSAQLSERTPWLLGFLCFLIPILPFYSVLPGPLKSNGSPARMIAVILVGLVVLGFLMVRRTTHAPRVSPGALILLVYFLLWLITYGVGLLAYAPTYEWTFTAASMIRTLIALIAHVGVGLYVLARARTVRQRDIVLGCLTAGLAFACLVGLLQSVTSIDLRFLLQPPGFVINTDNVGLAERIGVNRATGTSQHPIEFSTLATVTLLLTVYFARNAATRNVRVLSLAAFGLAVVAMPAAIARTGAISLAVALLILMFAFSVRHIAVGLIVGSAAVVGYIAAFPHIAQALWNTIVNSEDDPSVIGRTQDYALVSQIFRAHPLFGLGLGGRPPTQYAALDNEWLQAVVQGGFVGVAAMILLTGGGIFGIAAALRSAASRHEREQAFVLGAIFVAILASSFTFDLFGFEQATLIFFIVFGLLWSNFTVPLRPETDPCRPKGLRPNHSAACVAATASPEGQKL
jgi:polysaccharide biosynthesis protein PslJ